ncbi:MAG: type IV pilus twitching motility protein PilT [Opitutales bacterium]
MGYEMNDLLSLVVEEGASDLHLTVGMPPTLRSGGGMVPVDGPILSSEDLELLMRSITSENNQEQLKKVGGCDFGFAFRDHSRFRVSAFKTKSNYGIVLRQIPNQLFSLREIGLPDRIKELLTRPRGLILVTGPTGSGKSTTLASMINWINENRDGHIITIEDPIEYFHSHQKSIVTQREVGVDVTGFADAIRGALRQDPDVILVGEMRDLETIEAAVSAAETGHLVFATLHTTGAARTVDRIVDAFPSHTKDQIRTQLASSIIAVVSQVLCKRNGGGRVAGLEIMITTSSIASLIRDNKTYRIDSDIQTGANLGMISLDQHLLSLYNRGLIGAEDALEKAQHPEEMRAKIASLSPPEARQA